jgi:hypothetical protein
VCAQAEEDDFNLSTDGYKKSYCENATPNMCIVLLLPNGGAMFLDMDSVGDMAHSAEAFFLYHKKLIVKVTGNRPHRFGCLIVDNVPANLAGLRMLQREYPRMLGIPCYAHASNLLPKQLAKTKKDKSRSPRTDGVSSVMHTLLRVSLCVGDHAAIRVALRAKQTELGHSKAGISAHQPQRWGIMSKIANDVLRAKDAILLLVTADRDKWQNLASGSVNAHYLEKVIESSFIKKLEATAELLQVVSDASHQLEFDQPMLSQVLLTFVAMIDHATAWVGFYSDSRNPAKLPASMTKNVVESFEYRFWQHYRPFLPAAFILDPINFVPARNGSSGVRSPVDVLPESMRVDAVGEIARLAGVTVEAADEELGRFELEPWPAPMARIALVLSKKELIPANRRPAGVRTKVSPTAQRRGWAKKLPGWGFPSLGKAAVRLLSAHATSAAAERANSAYGSAYTSDRVSLARETADAIVRIRSAESQRRSQDDPNNFAELVTLKARPLLDASEGFFQRLMAEEMPAAAAAATAVAAAAATGAGAAAAGAVPRARGRPRVAAQGEEAAEEAVATTGGLLAAGATGPTGRRPTRAT